MLLRLPLSCVWYSGLLIRKLSIENSKFKSIISSVKDYFIFILFKYVLHTKKKNCKECKSPIKEVVNLYKEPHLGCGDTL